ncbi:MAG: transporter substrate-binding domain-containing protein [Myxococcota bacterium]
MRRWLVVVWIGMVCAALFGSVAQAQEPETEGGPLRVATLERPPFAMKNGEEFNGFSIDLWREVANALGRETEFIEARTIPALLDQVREGRVDAGIANITVSSKREEVLDFSQPMFDAGLRVMISADGGSTSILGAIFTWQMLGLVAAATVLLFVIGNVMWLLERREQEYFQTDYGEGAFRGFWWALNLIVNGGFEERMPQTVLGRLFAVLLVVGSLFIVSAFVAQITATLTVAELQSNISGVNDLYGKRVGTTAGSTAAEFLDQRSVGRIEYPDTDALFQALTDKDLDAVVHDAPILDYFAATKGRKQVRVVGEMLKPEKYAIAFPENSPLVEPVNRALLKLREDGTIAQIHARWFGAD